MNPGADHPPLSSSPLQTLTREHALMAEDLTPAALVNLRSPEERCTLLELQLADAHKQLADVRRALESEERAVLNLRRTHNALSRTLASVRAQNEGLREALAFASRHVLADALVTVLLAAVVSAMVTGAFLHAHG